jgi:hypothetical protein
VLEPDDDEADPDELLVPPELLDVPVPLDPELLDDELDPLVPELPELEDDGLAPLEDAVP